MAAEGLRFGALRRVIGGFAIDRPCPVVAVAIGCWCIVTAVATHAAQPPHVFDYWYIEPNSGTSSGGHAAVCLDDVCYHFQHTDLGTIRVRRDDVEQLDYVYRVLGNRTVHVTRVPIGNDTTARLRAAFDARWRVEDRQAEMLETLVQDRRLLEHLLATDLSSDAAREALVQLPGSAYFVADQHQQMQSWWPDEADSSPALDALRQQVGAMYGGDFLERRGGAIEAEIEGLTPPLAGAALPLPETGKLLAVGQGFAEHYRDLLTGLMALRVLREGRTLRPDALLASPEQEFSLDAREVDALRKYISRLRDTLVHLAGSTRPDWGYPLLVGMARLLALEASVRSSRLMVLDIFPEDASSIGPDTIAQHADSFAHMADERRADFVRLRHAFFDVSVPDEARLSLLEVAANVAMETQRGVTHHVSIRVHSGRPLPMKSSMRWDWPAPALSRAALEHALAVAQQREDTYRRALMRLSPYEVVRRNCVTEIFRTIETALASTPTTASSPQDLHRASREHLGGYVQWQGNLTFIPALSAHAVQAAYHVEHTLERPSYRRRALARMYARENAVRVDLRESNVLTAHSYERNDDDPAFLFFTDNVRLLRPVYGIANVLVGIGTTLAGTMLLPLDHGATLRAGMEGTLFSIPELAFISIRKGTFPFAPRRGVNDGDSGEQVQHPQPPVSNASCCSSAVVASHP